MDRFAKTFCRHYYDDQKNTTIISSGSGADDVNEGDPKPQRQYAFTQNDYAFSKLVVTDTITQEIILADAGEKAANFIVDALVEHVKDALNQKLINYLAAFGTPFNPSLFAGLLNISSRH